MFLIMVKVIILDDILILKLKPVLRFSFTNSYYSNYGRYFDSEKDKGEKKKGESSI